MEAPLKTLYAVSSTSLYQIDAIGPKRSSARKLVGRSASYIAREFDISMGGMIGIGRCLHAIPPDRTNLESTSGMWVFRSSTVVGLFLEREAALACLEAGEKTSFANFWLNASRDVIRRIGSDHPSILVFWDQLPRRLIT